MQVTMTFKFPEDKEELHHAQRGYDYYLAIREIAENVFTPNRKHGYPLGPVRDLLDDLGAEGQEIVRLLEEKFLKILNDNGIQL